MGKKLWVRNVKNTRPHRTRVKRGKLGTEPGLGRGLSEECF